MVILLFFLVAENEIYDYVFFISLYADTGTKKKYLNVRKVSPEAGATDIVFVYDEEYKYFIVNGG